MATNAPENITHQNGAAATMPQTSTPAPTPQTAMVPASAEGTIDAFASEGNFKAACRMAKPFADSTLVPDAYRGNIANVLIAMELASRIGASIFAVMQNMDIIHGRPSLRATFLIATVNASKRFSPLRFRWVGKEGTDSWGCRAVAKDRENGEECVGAAITIGMAKAEGWYQKNGSKWKTMAEQMIMYRAATFWTRVYAPEVAQGMHEREEVIDTVGYTVPELPTKLTPSSSKSLEDALTAQPEPAAAPAPIDCDPDTGEVLDPEQDGR